MNTPLVTGQCAQVLQLIRLHQPILSLNLTADHAIPETAARVHDLEPKGSTSSRQSIQRCNFAARFAGMLPVIPWAYLNGDSQNR